MVNLLLESDSFYLGGGVFSKALHAHILTGYRACLFAFLEEKQSSS